MNQNINEILPKRILEKMDFDYFTEYELLRDTGSKSENTQTLEYENEVEWQWNALANAANAMMQYMLTRTVGELVIINRGIEAPKGIKILLDKMLNTPLRDTVTDGVRNQIFSEPTLKLYEEDLAEFIRYKLANDINKIKMVLEATITELELRGTFHSLKSKVALIESEAKEVKSIIYEYVKSRECVKFLEAKLEDENNNFRLLKNDWIEQCELLEEEKDDCTIVNCIESRCILRWKQARLEQKEMIVDQERDALTQKLNDINTTHQNESNVTADIEEYMDYKISEVDGMIEKWMGKCDTEIDAMDDEIQVATENIKVLEVRAQVAEEEYTSHKKEMEDYWEQKRLAAEALLLQEKKLKYAIRIQAWWRGTMVRRHLGPYRRHKRGRGKKGKKAKKGKKSTAGKAKGGKKAK